MPVKLRHAPLVADARSMKQKYVEESDLNEDAVAEHEGQCQACEKEVALGTSKINCLDSRRLDPRYRVVSVRILARSDSSPFLRITAAWCKKCDVPISKVLTKYARTLSPPPLFI